MSRPLGRNAATQAHDGHDVRQPEIFVVSMNGKVILMVEAETDPADDDLVRECCDSLVTSGVDRADIDVIWQRRRVAQGTSL